MRTGPSASVAWNQHGGRYSTSPGCGHHNTCGEGATAVGRRSLPVTPSPRAFMLSLENADCKDSYMRMWGLPVLLPPCSFVRILTDSVLHRKNKRAWSDRAMSVGPIALPFTCSVASSSPAVVPAGNAVVLVCGQSSADCREDGWEDGRTFIDA